MEKKPVRCWKLTRKKKKNTVHIQDSIWLKDYIYFSSVTFPELSFNWQRTRNVPLLTLCLSALLLRRALELAEDPLIHSATPTHGLLVHPRDKERLQLKAGIQGLRKSNNISQPKWVRMYTTPLWAVTPMFYVFPYGALWFGFGFSHFLCIKCLYLLCLLLGDCSM